MEQVVEGGAMLATKGPGQVSPFAIPALSGSMAAALVSMKYGLTGPVITQVAACASSVIAFQDGLRLIRSGECDVVIAGGSEAALLPIAFAALGNMGALSKRNDDPTHASRPFDRDRDGFLFGEGAACVVLESVAHAMARGAGHLIQAEVIGASLTADAFHISAPEPTGLPSSAENAELGEIEDAICRSLQEQAESLLVAIITTSGMREFVFYTRAPQQLQRRFEQLRNHITSHEIQLMIQLDKTWGVYEQITAPYE